VPSKPGCTFEYIWGLIQKNASRVAPTPITPELVASICWEESMFNNIPQIKSGTAVGYGQVEPAELYRFSARGLQSQSPAIRATAEAAQAKGYAVYGLPPISKVGDQTSLNGSLNDEQAVQVTMGLLRDLHERKKGRAKILEAYAGMNFKGSQPKNLEGQGRQAIIDGWVRCEQKLLACSKTDADAVMLALKEARPFNQWEEFRKALFPKAGPSKVKPAA
jgi:hypothetical protein